MQVTGTVKVLAVARCPCVDHLRMVLIADMADEALVLARERVRARPLLRALRALSHLCLIMAVCAYLKKALA